jgi:hypothetical protein
MDKQIPSFGFYHISRLFDRLWDTMFAEFSCAGMRRGPEHWSIGRVNVNKQS